MRKRLEQLVNGIFEYEISKPSLSPEKIDTVMEEGSNAVGSFTVTAEDEKKIKGFIYSSNARVSFEPDSFNAVESRIMYRADLSGLRHGSVVEGCFTVCCDRGEYSVPYRFEVRSTKALAREKHARTPKYSSADLAELARTDITKARAVFASGKDLEIGEQNLLAGALNTREDPAQGLEQFLIGCGLKEPVEISIDENRVSMKNVQRSEKRKTLVRAGNWGFLRISVGSDARFLRLEKKEITTDDFAGGIYPLEYIVDRNFLHAGKNYGRITLRSCYQTLYLEIMVENPVDEVRASESHVRKMMQAKLLNLYLDFRFRKIDLQSWIDRSVSVLGSYKRQGGTDLFADLFLAQLYFADGKKVKGKRILDDLEQHPSRFRTRGQYAYFLYISTFFEQDSAYVDQVEARIEQLFLAERDNWILQWILLYLKESYLKSDSAKYEAILSSVRAGCSSPIMYLEATALLRKDPYLLRALDKDTLNILLFSAKRNQLTEELAFRIAALTVSEPVYKRKLYTILCDCYELTHSDETLRAILSILIAADKKDDKYFEWYARGVAADVRITGLYEYYMETMGTVGIEKMPQIIRMYFSYNQNLNYHKKAAIYRDISDNKDSVPQVYVSAKTGIDNFVVAQLSMGRIDENLAVLYERFLQKRLLNRELASKLVRLLFTFEVRCKNPEMKSVIVASSPLPGEQEVSIKNGRARVQIYTDKSIILLADEKGNRYASSSLYMAQRYMSSPLLLSYCRELVPDHQGLVLYDAASCENVTPDNLSSVQKAIDSDYIREEEKQRLRGLVLAYYRSHPREEGLYEYLSSISLTDYVRADKRTLIYLMTQEGMYEDAFTLLCEQGTEQTDLSCLVRICSQMVLVREFVQDKALLKLCGYCYQNGKYDDNILTYLLIYYEGPIEEMKRLWNTGHLNDLDTMTLEEKILSLVIFTRSGSEGTERIFASYQSKLGRRKICLAYLNLKSYEYFVKNLPVADLVFSHIEHRYLEEEELEDISALALLQYYANLSELTGQRREIVKDLLLKYHTRGMHFAFFLRFDPELRRFCQLEDKVILEYVANPSHEITLHYRIRGQEENWRSEPMHNCFEGIFVREFILFSDEILECYIEETAGGENIRRTDERTLRPASCGPDLGQYSRINEMAALMQAGDEEGLEQAISGFYVTKHLTETLFPLL